MLLNWDEHLYGWSAFIGFDECPLVILPQGERVDAHFVKIVS